MHLVGFTVKIDNVIFEKLYKFVINVCASVMT